MTWSDKRPWHNFHQGTIEQPFPKKIERISKFWKQHFYNMFIYLKWWFERPLSTSYSVKALFLPQPSDIIISIRGPSINITSFKGENASAMMDEVDCDRQDGQDGQDGQDCGIWKSKSRKKSDKIGKKRIKSENRIWFLITLFGKNAKMP